MLISIIAAVGKNNVIGVDNRLPWKLSADLKRFKAITSGKPVIMGRKTFESIGRPLPNRINIIITRDKNYKADGCVVVNSSEDALSAAKGSEEIMIIGGGRHIRNFCRWRKKCILQSLMRILKATLIFQNTIKANGKKYSGKSTLTII